MKLKIWRVVGSIVLTIAFFMAQADEQTYTITKSQNGKSYVTVGTGNPISIELDGSKYAEYVMALLSTSKPSLVYYKFSKITDGGVDGLQVECITCSAGYASTVQIFKNHPVPIPPPGPSPTADVAIKWTGADKGGTNWIYLMCGATPEHVLKFDYAFSTIIQLVLGNGATLSVKAENDADYKDFKLTIKQFTGP